MMELDKLYSSRFDEDTWKHRNKMWEVLCESFFNKYINVTDNVLDVAAGYCDFINNVAYDTSNKKMGRRIAVDLNPDVKLHSKKHVETYNTEAKDLSFLKDKSIDVVFVSNFFEHIKEKEEILLILDECLRVLRINGKLLILQPNINFLGGRYWDFFDHYTPINENSMKEALELINHIDIDLNKRVGFKTKLLIKKFLPYTTKSGIPQKPWLIKLYCHCPIAWQFMGKQMFVVAEKVVME